MTNAPLDIDFVASESWDADMHERTRALRENESIFWSEKTGTWIATEYEHVVYISKNHKLFWSGGGVLSRNPAKLSLIDEDEPRNTELRSLINRGFTPRMVKKLEEALLRITTEGQ